MTLDSLVPMLRVGTPSPRSAAFFFFAATK